MVQSTFTKQKRELAKAAALIERFRAQEVRTTIYDVDGTTALETTKEVYVDFEPESIFRSVLESAVKVVHEHGMRQQANATNRGKFSFCGIEAELTVPQLRALQDIVPLLSELTQRLPRANPKLVPNATVDGRPAFVHRKVAKTKFVTKLVPYEEKSNTRVRTYEEKEEKIDHYEEKVEIDYGLPIQAVTNLQQLTADLSTAIQCAIDEANMRGQAADPVLDEIMRKLAELFERGLPAKP